MPPPFVQSSFSDESNEEKSVYIPYHIIPMYLVPFPRLSVFNKESYNIRYSLHSAACVLREMLVSSDLDLHMQTCIQASKSSPGRGK